ncbi:MAG: hypothetical protein R3B09_20395 [Nannocystaceae bacterium]
MSPSTKRSTWRVAAAILGALHAAGAVAWWARMAGGFPIAHAHFVANRGIPALLVGVGVAMGLAAARGSEPGCRIGIAALAGGWLGFAVAARWVFPVSMARVEVWIVLVLAAAAASVALRRSSGVTRAAVLGPAIAVGVVALLVQRAPAPSTRPSGEPGVFTPLRPSPCDHTGLVEAELGPVHVVVAPLLTFESVSPDRCWTALAPGDAWRGRPPICVGEARDEDVLRVMFEGEGRSLLEVRARGSTLALDAITALDQPVYSHLNGFTAVRLEGPGSLSIALSPCEGLRLGFPAATREPLRFAALERADELAVFEATEAEKGPFTPLCRGPLRPGEPLILSIFADDVVVGELRVHDWAEQASLEPSPTAGWGIPQNAIELWGGESPGVGVVALSLAATSVGRGWHSVGHRAGVYRNRIEVIAAPADGAADGPARPGR